MRQRIGEHEARLPHATPRRRARSQLHAGQVILQPLSSTDSRFGAIDDVRDLEQIVRRRRSPGRCRRTAWRGAGSGRRDRRLGSAQGDLRRQIEVLQAPWPSSTASSELALAAASAQVQAETKPNQVRAVGTRPVRFFVASTNSATCGTPGWFQYHSMTQVPMRASGGRPFQRLQSPAGRRRDEPCFVSPN